MPDGTSQLIYRCDNPDTWVPVQGFILDDIVEDKEVRSCRIKFETPVRLKHYGRISQFANFRILVRSIITRVNALTYYFGESPINTDVKELLAEAEKVSVSKCQTRFLDYRWYSGRQKTSLRLGGLVGEMDYRGNISPFYSYLKMAEVLGVGKNTTFGFGRIKVEI